MSTPPLTQNPTGETTVNVNEVSGQAIGDPNIFDLTDAKTFRYSLHSAIRGILTKMRTASLLVVFTSLIIAVLLTILMIFNYLSPSDLTNNLWNFFSWNSGHILASMFCFSNANYYLSINDKTPPSIWQKFSIITAVVISFIATSLSLVYCVGTSVIINGCGANTNSNVLCGGNDHKYFIWYFIFSWGIFLIGVVQTIAIAVMSFDAVKLITAAFKSGYVKAVNYYKNKEMPTKDHCYFRFPSAVHPGPHDRKKMEQAARHHNIDTHELHKSPSDFMKGYEKYNEYLPKK